MTTRTTIPCAIFPEIPKPRGSQELIAAAAANQLPYISKQVNTVLNVHSNHSRRIRDGRGEGGKAEDYIPIATLSPPEWLMH